MKWCSFNPQRDAGIYVCNREVGVLFCCILDCKTDSFKLSSRRIDSVTPVYATFWVYFFVLHVFPERSDETWWKGKLIYFCLPAASVTFLFCLECDGIIVVFGWISTGIMWMSECMLPCCLASSCLKRGRTRFVFNHFDKDVPSLDKVAAPPAIGGHSCVFATDKLKYSRLALPG